MSAGRASAWRNRLSNKKYFIAEMPDDDRCWRLDWLGKLVFNPTVPDEPWIEVFLRPLSAAEPSRDFFALEHLASSKPVRRRIGVGQLPLLRPGTFWRRGYLLAPRAGTDIPEVPIIASGIEGRAIRGADLSRSLPNGVHGIPERRLGYHLLVPVTGGPAAECFSELIVPCWELIRFYLAFTTRLANTVFAERFRLDIRRTAELLPEPLFSSKERAAIRVGHGFSVAEAWILARILTSPLALRAASLPTSSRRLGSVTSARPRYPLGDFPFEGVTNLSMRGRRVQGDDGVWRFWVSEIIRCSHPFPFTDLVVEFPTPKNRERPEPTTEPGAGNVRDRDVLEDDEQAAIVQSIVAPLKRSSAIELHETPSQFDALVGHEAELLRTDQIGREKPADPAVPIDTPRKKFSTSAEATGGDPNIGRAAIVPGQSGDDTKPDPKTYFSSILRSFVADYGIVVEFHKCEIHDHNFMPGLKKGDLAGWHMVKEPTLHVRRLYIAEFKIGGFWVMTLDFERRRESGQQHGIPFIVEKDGERLTEERISHVVRLLRNNWGVWTAVDRALKSSTLSMKVVDHSWKADYKSLAGRYLSHIDRLIAPLVRRLERRRR